jgi:hypothetical protein
MKVVSLSLGLIVPFTVSGFVAVAWAQITCTFPSVKDSCSDPQARRAIEWMAPSEGGRHVLWLKTISTGARTRLLEFDRSVDVLWSPTGRALAVTDHAGSNDSMLWVFTGSTLMRAISVDERLRSSLGRLPAIYNNGHRYFEAVRWMAPEVLKFRVRAYDSDPLKEYVATFRFDLAGRVSPDRTK